MSTPSTTTIQRVQEWSDARFLVDREAGLLAVLFLGVQVAAIQLARVIATAPTQPERPVAQGSSDAAAGAAWVGAEVAFAILLLGVILIYKRAPEWIRRIIKYNVLIGAAAWLGADAARDGVFPDGVLLILALLSVLMAIDHFDLYWILNNIAAVLLAILFGAVLAFLFGITGLLVAFIGLTLYDHVFANKHRWMFDIAELLVKLRLPVLFIRPPSLRYDWNTLLDEEDSEDGEEADEARRDQWGIGTADLALPAAFAAAIAVAPTGTFLATGLLAATFVVAGVLVACFRLRWEIIHQGSGAGLPALSMGALGGWLLAQPLLLVIT